MQLVESTLIAVPVSIILTEVDNGMLPGWMGEGNSLSVLGYAGKDGRHGSATGLQLHWKSSLYHQGGEG